MTLERRCMDVNRRQYNVVLASCAGWELHRVLSNNWASLKSSERCYEEKEPLTETYQGYCSKSVFPVFLLQIFSNFT